MKKFFLSLVFLCILAFGFSTGVQSATFSMNPVNESFPRGCVRSITIAIDATGENVNAAEVEVFFDPAQITILDSNSDIPGTQIQPGNAFESYFYNVVDQVAGRIQLAGASFVNTLTSNRTFATIEFRSEPTATNIPFTIRFDGAGATLDSNIADAVTNDDLLTGVTNGSYSFFDGPCVADTQPPQVNFITPTNGQTGFPVDANLQVRITDNQSGVDLSTVELIVNGTTFRPTDPEVSYTGDPLNYVFTINPPFNLPDNEASTLRVRANDNSGNSVNRLVTFNIPAPPPPPPAPPRDRLAPVVVFTNPTETVTNLDVFADLSFIISDPQEGEVISGVDITTLEVALNGEEYDESEVIYTGDPSSYSVLVTPRVPLLEDDINFLQVRGRDIQGNRVNTTTAFILSREFICEENDDEDDNEIDNDIPVSEVIEEIIVEENCFGEEISSNELAEIITDVITGGNIFDDTGLEDSFVSAYADDNSLVGLGALLGLLATLLGLLPLIGLAVTAPRLFALFLAALFGRRNKKPWGTVTNAITGEPIPFVIGQLYVAGSQYKIDQTVTDLEGRYGFVISEGSFRIEMKQSGFKPFTDTITIEKDQLSYVKDVKLVPYNSQLDSSTNVEISFVGKFLRTLWQVYRSLIPLIFGVGFAFAILAMLISPNTWNTIVLIGYIIIILLYAMPRLQRKTKYASVIDSETNLRIPYAQIKIYDPTSWTVVDSVVTNYNGMFDFYGEPGRYAVLVAARGYTFPSVKNTYPLAKNKYQGIILVDLKKGRNKLSLYVDPVRSGVAVDNTTSAGIASPFS